MLQANGNVGCRPGHVRIRDSQAEDEMSSMTVWKFPTPYGADAALEKLNALQTQQLITVQDAAVVSWGRGRGSRRPAR